MSAHGARALANIARSGTSFQVADARMRLEDRRACHVPRWDAYIGRVICGATMDVERLSVVDADYMGADQACVECRYYAKVRR